MPIDKQQLYGHFQQSHDRRERLADTITRKALDIPMDDDVNITTTNHGSSPFVTALAVVGMLATGGTFAIGTAAMMGVLSPTKSVPNSPAKQAAAQVPAPNNYRVTFWNEEGDQMQVDDIRRPETPTPATKNEDPSDAARQQQNQP